MIETKSCILLVDDSRSARERFEALFKKAGYWVSCAGDGQEGLEKLQTNAVDLIISDLEMPLLDGLGFCQAVKGDRKLRHSYFIMLTAQTELRCRLQCLNSGADDCILKTAHPAELLARVHAGLRSRRLERERQQTQAELLHTEKMSTIARLAAELTHEINNPLGYIISNLGSLKKYQSQLSRYIAAQNEALSSAPSPPPQAQQLLEQRRQLKIDQIIDDGEELINESRSGAEHIAKVVAELRKFMLVDRVDGDIDRQLKKFPNLPCPGDRGAFHG